MKYQSSLRAQLTLLCISDKLQTELQKWHAQQRDKRNMAANGLRQLFLQLILE